MSMMQHYNRYLNIRITKICSGVEAGILKRKGIFRTSFISNATQPQSLDRNQRTLNQQIQIYVFLCTLNLHVENVALKQNVIVFVSQN